MSTRARTGPRSTPAHGFSTLSLSSPGIFEKEAIQCRIHRPPQQSPEAHSGLISHLCPSSSATHPQLPCPGSLYTQLYIVSLLGFIKASTSTLRAKLCPLQSSNTKVYPEDLIM